MNRDIVRRCIFRPYRKGMGPVFTLTVWNAGTEPRYGKSRLGYELRINQDGSNRSLFRGEDFCCSPLHAIDADETMAGLMGFLTLRPGDTDAEYFDGYTTAQREYCSQWAEALGGEVMCRFERDQC